MHETESPTTAPIVRGIEENLWAMWSRFGRGNACQLHESENAIWFDTPIPTLPYNTVIKFNAADDAEQRIDEIFEHYRERNVPFAWIVHPSAQPRDLDARLQDRGLEEAEVAMGMAMELDALPALDEAPAGIEIEEVDEESDVMEFLELAAWRWEVPADAVHHLADLEAAFKVGAAGSPIRAWLARRDGVAVSKATLCLDAGVAGVYGVATRPEARGMGLARNLTLAALRAARSAGYGRAVLHSSPMARSLYRSIGFREYAPFKVFAPPRSFHL